MSPWCRRSVERRRELSEIRNSNIFSHIEYMRGEGACVQEFLKVSPPRGQTGYDDGKLASIIVCSQFQKKRAHMPLFRILYNMFMHLIKAQKREGQKLFILSFVREIVIPRRVEILFFPRSIPPYSDAAVQWWCPKLQPSRS